MSIRPFTFFKLRIAKNTLVHFIPISGSYTPNEKKLSAWDCDERMIWIADPHCHDGLRFVVRDYLRIHDSISGLDAAAWKRIASAV
jgi:hypothetical protein